MSSVSIKSAKERYGGTTDAETISNMARAHNCYRVYKYANDYGDKVTHTDYKLVASDADEAALRSSNLVHNVALVYDRGKVVNVEATPNPASQRTPKPPEGGQSVAATGTETDWYIATSDAKHTRQIVINLPADARVLSRVEGSFVGPMSRAARQNWAAMTLFMSGDTPDRRGPFIFAKANGVVELLRDCPAKVSFSFCRFAAGGLLQIFLHVDSRAVEQRARSPYLVENGHWPEADDTRQVIPPLISREHLEVCFVADGPIGPCQGYFGLRVPLSEGVRSALTDEWKNLNDYHSSLPSSRRSHPEAMNQFERENPMEANPILARPTTASVRTERAKSSPDRSWWQFWK
jgi:hypothetical protein